MFLFGDAVNDRAFGVTLFVVMFAVGMIFWLIANWHDRKRREVCQQFGEFVDCYVEDLLNGLNTTQLGCQETRYRAKLPAHERELFSQTCRKVRAMYAALHPTERVTIDPLKSTVR